MSLLMTVVLCFVSGQPIAAGVLIGMTVTALLLFTLNEWSVRL